MRKILIIETPYIFTQSNNRTVSISEILTEIDNVSVKRVSTNFSHQEKRKVDEKEVPKNLDYEVNIIDTLTYRKNVSFKRIISQKIYSIKLNRYLNSIEKPDLIYNFVPSLNVADVVRKYSIKNDIPVIIDVRDLWPEAFKLIIKNKFLQKLFFSNMEKKADNIYNNASGIIAVSNSYLLRALKKRDDNVPKDVVYLGTNFNKFDKYASSVSNNELDIQTMAYVGTLGHSYDLMTTFDALKILKEKGVELSFQIYGDGPLLNKYKNYSVGLGLNVSFNGNLKYEDLVTKLTKANFVINPISKGAAQSIINKHADYAASGKAVLNTQENEEYKYLVEKYNIGLNVENSNPLDLANKIEFFINHPDKVRDMGKNHRILGEERFDRQITYNKIKKMAEGILNQNEKNINISKRLSE